MNDDLEGRIILLEHWVAELRRQARFQDVQMRLIEAGFKSLTANSQRAGDINEDVAWDGTILH